MLHKTQTFSTRDKIVKKKFPTRTKWKDLLLDVNAVGEMVVLEAISLSKLSSIKKENKL